MSDNPAFRHLQPSVIEAIPERCVDCPALLGRLSVFNMFMDNTIEDREATWNPLKRLALSLSMKMSEARLLSDLHDRVIIMRNDCEVGSIQYPVGFDESTTLCGVSVRRELSESVTNEL